MTTTSMTARDSSDVFLDDTEDSMIDVTASELHDFISEPFFHEQSDSARRVVASYAENSQECRDFMLMLGIFPGQVTE